MYRLSVSRSNHSVTGRSRRRRSRPAVAACLALSAAAALQAPAASAQALSADVGHVWAQLPTDVMVYSAFYRELYEPPVLAPDGRLRWYYERQRASDDVQELGAFDIGPDAGSFGRLSAEFSVVSRTAAQRESPRGAVAAVAGRTWVLDRPTAPRPVRSRLLGFGDDGSVVARRLPVGFEGSQLVVTSRGIRVLGNVKVGDRRHAAVTTPSLRRTVRLPHFAADGGLRAATVGRGDLLIAGEASASGLPTAMVHVTPGGKVRRLNDRRVAGAASSTARAGIVSTRFGVLADEASDGDLMEKTALVLRSATGRVAVRRQLARLGTEAIGGASCPRYRVEQLAAGPDGYPLAEVTCEQQLTVADPWGNYPRWTTTSRWVISLDHRLRARWTRSLGVVLPEPGYQQPCRHLLTAPDQRLWSLYCDAQTSTIEATTVRVPGLSAPSKGKLLGNRRGKRSGVVARIRCSGDHGKVCVGEAVVTTRSGEELGSATYALPARPGNAAAETLRVIATDAQVPASYRVRLVATDAR